MRCAIAAVGDELLRGIVLDTNSHWIARRLAGAGHDVNIKLTLPDDPEVVARELSRLRGYDLVVVTGGLGPTDDDRTMQAVAAALGVSLQERPAAVATLTEFYDRLAAAGWLEGGLDESRRRMACLPEGAEILPNPVGAAPGAWAAPFVVLPGVPSEMKGMWEEAVAPRLGLPSVVELTGTIDSDDESALAGAAAAVAGRYPDVYFKTRAQDFGGSGVVVTAFGPEERAAEALDEFARTTGLGWREQYAPREAS